jgi:hypothetical protein
MTNHLTDYQKEVFIDIYKTSLGAMLSTNQFPDSIAINDSIDVSAKIAFATVELLTDSEGIRKPSDIIQALENIRRDEPLEFPHVEE